MRPTTTIRHRTVAAAATVALTLLASAALSGTASAADLQVGACAPATTAPAPASTGSTGAAAPATNPPAPNPPAGTGAPAAPTSADDTAEPPSDGTPSTTPGDARTGDLRAVTPAPPPGVVPAAGDTGASTPDAAAPPTTPPGDDGEHAGTGGDGPSPGAGDDEGAPAPAPAPVAAPTAVPVAPAAAPVATLAAAPTPSPAATPAPGATPVAAPMPGPAPAPAPATAPAPVDAGAMTAPPQPADPPVPALGLDIGVGISVGGDGGGDGGGGAAQACATPSPRPYFQKADWLWNEIPANPVLDPKSAAMAGDLATGDHIANTGDFGVTLRGPMGITAATPRFPVVFSEEGNWGPDPFGGKTMPIPPGTPIAPGSDGHLAVADPTTNQVYNLWMARSAGATWDAGWGAATPLDGDGRETDGSSTGAGLARYAAVVRESEIKAGDIPHALFFSTNMAAPGVFRYPATKTDGSNDDNQPNPIPEGARVQLDPSLDLDSLPGLTPAERTVAKALQTYGAYVGDNGGARMAFLFEYAPDTSTYADAGLDGGYASLANIPWDRLRVLANWDGGNARA